MSQLCQFDRDYAVFENNVRQLGEALWSRSCGTCHHVCCRPDFCRETLDSVFLSRLRKIERPAISYSPVTGWLTSAGCALRWGRPPVCYQYLCNPILESQPSPEHRYVIRVLAQLIGHVGKNAVGSCHLVEIMDSGRLERINVERLERRLEAGRAAFRAIQGFLNGSPLSLPELVQILPMTNTHRTNRIDVSHRVRRGLGADRSA
jgi:hypothetical protein